MGLSSTVCGLLESCGGFQICVVSLRAVVRLSFTVCGLLESCGGFQICVVSLRTLVGLSSV